MRWVQAGQSVRFGHIHECAVRTCAPPISGAAAEALADHEARRQAEDLRGLLGRVLDEVEDLHPELREAIERALALMPETGTRAYLSPTPSIRALHHARWTSPSRASC
jgi:hypothetical protein